MKPDDNEAAGGSEAPAPTDHAVMEHGFNDNGFRVWRVLLNDELLATCRSAEAAGLIVTAVNERASLIAERDALEEALREATDTVAGLYDPADEDDPAPIHLARWRKLIGGSR